MGSDEAVPRGPRGTIEGRNPVIEALRSGRPLVKIMIARGIEPAFARNVRFLARNAGVPVVEIERAHLDSMALTRKHQGVIAIGAAVRYREADELLDGTGDGGQPPFIVVLDGIEDPQNLGAIIRTCDAVGATGVIIPKRRACGLTGAVARASAGAVEHVACARVANLAGEVERLKAKGLWAIGADTGAARTVYEADLTGPLAVVIGSEGRGISSIVKSKCDLLVRIPLRGHTSSLNASVAAAVIAYETLRQREATGRG